MQSNGRFVKIHIELRNIALGTLKNIIPTSNLLLNSYFKNPTVGSHFIFVLNMHDNFHANQV